jgi:hypothetical protein
VRDVGLLAHQSVRHQRGVAARPVQCDLPDAAHISQISAPTPPHLRQQSRHHPRALTLLISWGLDNVMLNGVKHLAKHEGLSTIH